MTAQDRVSIIERRIRDAFSPLHLQVIDESDQHIGHAGHQGGGRHFAVVISGECFPGLSRVDAHRKIYGLFTDLMPEQIHALKIKVV